MQKPYIVVIQMQIHLGPNITLKQPATTGFFFFFSSICTMECQVIQLVSSYFLFILIHVNKEKRVSLEENLEYFSLWNEMGP